MNKKVRLIYRDPRFRLAAKFTLIFLFFLSLSWQRLDPDFGWHLTSGDYYRHHGIPSHDIYTYTASNFPWINHEWGNDVLLSIFYSIGGYFLISMIYAGLWTAALFVRAAKTRWFLLVLASLAVIPYAGIRPVAWTFLFFAILLNLLESKKRIPYISICVLFILWANLHAGFIVGLASIAFYLIKTRDIKFAKIFGVAAVSTLVNPYGPRLYEEVARTLFDSKLHSQIVEWSSLWIFNVSFPFIALWIAGFILYKRRPLGNWFNLGPLLLASSLAATRNLPLFVIATVKETNDFYDKFRRSMPKLNLAAKSVLTSSLAILVLALFYVSYPAFLFWHNRYSAYPDQAVSYLNNHPCHGNLFNDYNYGGYLIWKLPNTPLYIDGRMSPWRDPTGTKYLTTYLNLLKNNNLRESQFNKYGIKCVLIKSSNKRFVEDLKSDNWNVVNEGNGAVLLKQG